MEAPERITKNDDDLALQIVWRDGVTTETPYRFLRLSCVCARCVHELTGAALLDPDSVPDDVGIREMKLVGNYALKIVWSDGHDTGLYTWERLAELTRDGNGNSGR